MCIHTLSRTVAGMKGRKHSEEDDSMNDPVSRDDLHRGLFERIPTGLLHFSEDLKLIHCNQALAEILGYPDPESLMSAADRVDRWFVHSDDGKRMADALFADDAVNRLETRMLKRSGDSVWISQD